MIWQRTRIAVLAAMVLASAAYMARADDKDTTKDDVKKDEAKKDEAKKADTKKEEKLGDATEKKTTAPTPLADAGCGGGCGPAYKTIWVTEYRTAYREEKYTGYREICVPETRTYTTTCYQSVPEYKDVVRTVCVPVTTCEERVVYKKQVICKQVTEYKTKKVNHGYWECCEVPVTDWFAAFRKHGCNDCCEPCVKTRTKKVWHNNWVCETYPVCRTVHETICVPTTCKVQVCKMV